MDDDRKTSGEDSLAETMTRMFATNWIEATKLLRKVLEAHDHGFVLDGDLVNDIRIFLGDASLIPGAPTIAIRESAE